MATRAVNIKLDEEKIRAVKSVAQTFRMTMTDIFNEALDAYLADAMKDPLYRLTANAEAASAEESEEILQALENLSDDDLAIASVKKFEAA